MMRTRTFSKKCHSNPMLSCLSKSSWTPTSPGEMFVKSKCIFLLRDTLTLKVFISWYVLTMPGRQQAREGYWPLQKKQSLSMFLSHGVFCNWTAQRRNPILWSAGSMGTWFCSCPGFSSWPRDFQGLSLCGVWHEWTFSNRSRVAWGIARRWGQRRWRRLEREEGIISLPEGILSDPGHSLSEGLGTQHKTESRQLVPKPYLPATTLASHSTSLSLISSFEKFFFRPKDAVSFQL